MAVVLVIVVRPGRGLSVGMIMIGVCDGSGGLVLIPSSVGFIGRE